MSVRRLVHAIAFGSAALLALAACGPPGPSATAATVATADAASQPPDEPFPSFDLGSFDLGSFAVPSFSSDPELEAMLPDELGGSTVRKQSVSGSTFLAMGIAGASALEALLDGLDRAPDDLSVAIGSNTTVTIIAYRITGVTAEQLFAGLETALMAAPGATVTDTQVAGRSVKKVVAAAETTHVYLTDDTTFVIGGNVSPALLEETVQKLSGG